MTPRSPSALPATRPAMLAAVEACSRRTAHTSFSTPTDPPTPTLWATWASTAQTTMKCPQTISTSVNAATAYPNTVPTRQRSNAQSFFGVAESRRGSTNYSRSVSPRHDTTICCRSRCASTFACLSFFSAIRHITASNAANPRM
jgi:hypothetical protein